MIGIVLVSHSPALAKSALALALEMIPGDKPKVAIAAGAGPDILGTDAVRVAEAIGEVASPDGVLVFMDLGSAVLSAEMALEFVTAGDMPIVLSSAPFVEGLVAGLVRAAGGGSLQEVASEARGALIAKSSQLEDEHGADVSEAAPTKMAAGADAFADLTLTNADGMHARPASLVSSALSGLDATVTIRNERTGTLVADASSMTMLLTLGARAGDALRVSASGPDATLAVDTVAKLVAERFGEEAMSGSGERESVQDASGSSSDRVRAAGPIGVSPGRVIGVVARMPELITEPKPSAPIAGDRREAESARIGPAAEAVRIALRMRAERTIPGPVGDGARSILEATATLAVDPAASAAARARVLDQGESADRAVWIAFSSLSDQLARQGGRIAERVADLRDVRDRIVAELRGEPAPGVPDPGRPFVLVARDLAPADTALLDPSRCVGLITAEGGPTSHTAILARSLGIAAVVAAPQALTIPDGVAVLLDGTTGEIVRDPSPELVQAAARAPQAPGFDGAGRTADGRRIELLANVGSADNVPAAVAASAEGVGLFRTEFCFLDRETAPGIGEQTGAYRAVLSGFPERKVIVRTLDAGADKPLPFLTNSAETNPALGVRGFRTSWQHPEILEQQLTAIAAAEQAESAEVWVMAPMIDSASEAEDFVRRCRAHGLQRAGVMIETPAAALTAQDIFRVVDFVSVGTNDLAQYTMAADRLIGDLAALNDAWQPAVLRLIEMIGSAGAQAGKPVGVCGEAAADPALAPVLTGLGVTSLSMTPRAIDAVAYRLSRVSWEQCRQASEVALAAADAAEARRAVSAVLGD